MIISKITKKTLEYLLTFGASILLGFLSFVGFYALFPILPLAIAAFFLAVVYEYEVYIQNIRKAWQILKNQIIHDWKFFKNTKAPTEITHVEHSHSHSSHEAHQYTKKTYLVLAFSLCAGAFMTLGTIMLLQESLALVGFLSVLSTNPVGLILLSLLVGIAYAHITFSSLSTLILENTLKKWWEDIKNAYKKGLNLKSIGFIVASITLIALTIALTICTAGTWSTIAQKAQSLLKIPKVLVSIIHPIIISFSTIFFNLQNTYESINEVSKAKLTTNIWSQIKLSLITEHWLQIINPFRIILKLTLMPLRIICFLLHLVSIGVTADRLPKVPQIVAALLGIISEGFEDLHYFLDLNVDSADSKHHTHNCQHHNENEHQHSHDHASAHAGHSHNNDLPTKILNILFCPVKLLASLWHYTAGRLSAKPKPFKEILKSTFAFEIQSFFTHSHAEIMKNLPPVATYSATHNPHAQQPPPEQKNSQELEISNRFDNHI